MPNSKTPVAELIQADMPSSPNLDNLKGQTAPVKKRHSRSRNNHSSHEYSVHHLSASKKNHCNRLHKHELTPVSPTQTFEQTMDSISNQSDLLQTTDISKSFVNPAPLSSGADFTSSPADTAPKTASRRRTALRSRRSRKASLSLISDASMTDSNENTTIEHPNLEHIDDLAQTDISQNSIDSPPIYDEASDNNLANDIKKSRRGKRGGRGHKRKTKREEVHHELDVLDDTFVDDSDFVEAQTTHIENRKMYISILPSEQVEVAIVKEGLVQEYYLEMRHQAKMKGNIYKGIVNNIDTNLQAAFINYGSGKNGFLQIDEIHPEYFLAQHEPLKGKNFPPIQKVLRIGQELLVQVVKEPTGNKGAFLTTWLSLAGRFLVLTPGQEQIGISRKVEDEAERARLKEMIEGIVPGDDLGVIVRTVSEGTSKTTLKNDLQYLKRVWKDIRKRGTTESAPKLIYQEPGLAERAVRDYLTEDINEIWVDNSETANALRDTASLLFPRKSDLVKVHADKRQGMWERFNLQNQLEQIYAREVLLPSGGRLVFDQTEALLAIDINSGKISGKSNFEAMAYRTNIEAAEAIARQLKLRDIGGQVVIDFIEMREKNHIREVEKTLRMAMKADRARHDIARMSSFGLLELVRQRTGSSALSITMETCPHCGGTGLRRNLEWQALQAIRDIRRMITTTNEDKCIYSTSAEVGLYLLNNKRQTLQRLEQDGGKTIEISLRP